MSDVENNMKTPPENTDWAQADTEPVTPYTGQVSEDDGLKAPPRILFYGVIILFMLGIIGALTGVVVFRDVLRPAQQQRVMGILPFMEAFLPARPAPDAIVPTSSAPVDEEAAQSLLDSPLDGDSSSENQSSGSAPGGLLEMTPEVTPESTPESTPEATTPPTVTPTPTMQPTMTPTPQPTTPPTATSTPAQSAANISATFDAAAASSGRTRNWATSALNTGFTWEEQTWNNCGPANITMAMSYYGWTRDHQYAANRLKPDREDKNVSPWEMVEFTEEYSDLDALWRHGGDLDLLRDLIDSGFPVIVERSHMFEGYEWLGHYQTLVGYDDTTREFYIYDSFLGNGDGSGIKETYTEVDDGWRHFNRKFVVIYPPDQETEVMSILGELSDPEAAAEHAFEVAQQEANENPQDAFAWFNMGTSLNELERYERAKTAFDRALTLGLPWRMLWYQFGPFETYYHVGRYEDVLRYADNNLSNNGRYVEETYYWKGRALAAQGDTAGARQAFRQALNLNDGYVDARQALETLNS